MEVVILRHGKVNYPPIATLSALEFKGWVDAYNSNELDKSLAPTEDALKLATKMNAVVCSSLPRSIQSAQYLGFDDITVIDSRFREAELPIGAWKFPKLSIRIWVILFRAAWRFGYSNGSESFSDAKERARFATETLVQMAQEHQRVLFVGHGILNRLIAKELRQSGWVGPKVPSQKYWDYSVYTPGD